MDKKKNDNVVEINIITPEMLDAYSSDEKDVIMKKLWDYVRDHNDVKGPLWSDLIKDVGLTTREFNYLMAKF